MKAFAVLMALLSAATFSIKAHAQVLYARLSGGGFAYVSTEDASTRVLPHGVLATQSMTFDPEARVLYGVNSAPPHLVRVDLQRSGLPDTVGVIYENTVGDVRRAEAIAYSICERLLYGSVSLGDDYTSEYLATIDPVTARIIDKWLFTGMVQNDGDALEFVGCQLYAIDVAGVPSYLYAMSGSRGYCVGTCSGSGSLGLDNCQDMAYDWTNGVLYGTDPNARELAIIDVDSGIAAVVGTTPLGIRSLAFDPLGPDCDGDEINDDDEIQGHPSLDFNSDEILDSCQPHVSTVTETPNGLFVLYQSQPNPFNPRSQIVFSLRQPATVTLDIMDGKGQIVRRLLSGVQLSASAHSVYWDGDDERNMAVAAGVYFYRITVDGRSESRKMVMLK